MNVIVLGILYLVSVAFLISLFFRFLLKTKGPWGNFWAFFIIILLAVFAADAWIGPVGPYIYDEIYWVPPLAVGLLVALLLAATAPSPKAREKLKLHKEDLAEDQDTAVVFGTFFWFLLVAMVFLIVLGLF